MALTQNKIFYANKISEKINFFCFQLDLAIPEVMVAMEAMEDTGVSVTTLKIQIIGFLLLPRN